MNKDSFFCITDSVCIMNFLKYIFHFLLLQRHNQHFTVFIGYGVNNPGGAGSRRPLFTSMEERPWSTHSMIAGLGILAPYYLIILPPHKLLASLGIINLDVRSSLRLISFKYQLLHRWAFWAIRVEGERGFLGRTGGKVFFWGMKVEEGGVFRAGRWREIGVCITGLFIAFITKLYFM